jgi:hypothetical protein
MDTRDVDQDKVLVSFRRIGAACPGRMTELNDQTHSDFLTKKVPFHF